MTNRLDALQENTLLSELLAIEADQRDIKSAQFIGSASGLRSYVVTSGNTFDVNLPFNTGSIFTAGTVDLLFTFLATSQAQPYAKPAGSVWIDVADNAHVLGFPSDTATGTNGVVERNGRYFALTPASYTTPNMQQFRLQLTLRGQGTLLIKWSAAATDQGTVGVSGSYAWPGTSGSI